MAIKAKQKHQPTRAAMLSEHAKNTSATKKGPGRFHKQGHEKASPVPGRGASNGLVLHAASAAKKERRALVKAHGRRQAIKMLKYWRAEDRYAKKLEDDERMAASSYPVEG